MGVDLFIKLREPIQYGELPVKTTLHSPFTRGFGHLIQNALNNDDPIIPKIEKALNTKLGFLIRPNFYYYHTSEDDIEFAPEDIQETMRQQMKIEKVKSEASWVDINEFIKNLNKLLESIRYNPTYYSQVEYDRSYWLNYLDNDNFEKDLNKLLVFLEYLIKIGQKEFTFDMG